jgi:hypothetical protein
MATVIRTQWDSAWGGIALIALGLIFLVQNYFGFELRNWWALFILIPAAGALASGYYTWRAGHTAAAAGSLMIGLVFVAIAGIFLLELPWRLAWPVLLIIAGIGIILPQLVRGARGNSG